MRILLLGATGMVGQGVLRECLLDSGVERVISVGRSATDQTHAKLKQIVHKNLLDLSAIENELAGIDACFFCLGISSLGMSEEDYTAVTYDITVAVANTLVRTSPSAVFIFVSAAGTDSTERGRVMWARVKGRTENALLRMPFKAVYVFRPAAIIPQHGVKSRTNWYNVLYAALRPLVPVFKALFPKQVTTTERVGRAMINVARGGFPKPILESADIDRVGATA